MNYRYRTVIIVTIVSGAIFLTLVYNLLSQVLAVYIGIFSIFGTVATFLLLRNINKPEEFVEHFGEADILNRLWYPIQDELMDVVNRGGRVTGPASAWARAPRLSKMETERSFFSRMQRYVRQREHVASLASSDLATEQSRQELASEQETLLSMAQELLVKVNVAIDSNPASTTFARRTRRPRPAATRPGVGTRQPASDFRSAPVQTANRARTIRERPAASRAAPSPPPRITYTPMSSSSVATPPPRQPETPSPPSARPGPSSVTESVTEPVEAVPSPSEREPAAQPSEPPGDRQVDVASVCEELFNSKMMSYATNRLFDERYKDATVRWKGVARRASTYSYDFEFGDGGGTKAELDVYEIKQQYGSRTVKAFVQLPVEAAEVIGARLGKDIEFEGRLMTCEGSARRLYVADARMVD